MPIVVVAKTEEEFGQWLTEQKAGQEAEAAGADREWNMGDLMAKGSEVYSANCVACHQANGEGIPGAFPPLVNGKTFAGAVDATQRLRERGFLNEENQIVLGSVEDHIALVMSGVSGTAMAAFGSQLSDVEMAAVITYERNAWGNDTGDVVQPMAVKALR